MGLLNYDFEVLVDFVAYYFFAAMAWAVVTIVVCGVICFRRRARDKFFNLKSIGKFVLWSLIAWCAFFASTAKWRFLELSLDTESSATADYAYHHLLVDYSLNTCVRLAANHRQWQTVRFYAACRIGEMLAVNNDEQELQRVLKQMENVPPIAPCFFGTNSVNSDLFVTGTIAGPYEVRELIEHKYHQARHE
ncbi:MAG: hypothetical protein JWR26_496 [Pedosphaera sp.]|nr:hypothetical protein [Pedosphaera sp.]